MLIVNNFAQIKIFDNFPIIFFFNSIFEVKSIIDSFCIQPDLNPKYLICQHLIKIELIDHGREHFEDHLHNLACAHDINNYGRNIAVDDLVDLHLVARV